jgi:RNA polymerase subunit RPABC4/transcription elongation factor Spt4
MDQPAAELVGYRCRDCESIVTEGDGSCPECGCEELEQAHETVEYAYWGQYH